MSQGRAQSASINSVIELEVIDLGILTRVVPGKCRRVRMPHSHCACAKWKKKENEKGGIEPRPLALRVVVLPTVLTFPDRCCMVKSSTYHPVFFRDHFRWRFLGNSRVSFPKLLFSGASGISFRQIAHTKKNKEN